jgi:hypothetical protein
MTSPDQPCPRRPLSLVGRLCPWLATLLVLAASAVQAMDQDAYTPPPMAPDRQAICDAMRHYVLERERPVKLPQPIVFKIEYMKVRGAFAAFEGFAQFKDGSQAAGAVLADLVYTTFLQRGKGGRWSVIADLSRTDVPDEAELRQIRGHFPKRIPTDIIPEFWRDKLR